MSEMNYFDTFIRVAPDCPVAAAVPPPQRGRAKSIPLLEYEILSAAPYRITQEELLFEVHLQHKGLTDRAETERSDLRQAFFSRPRPCLRASSLPKRYGWGVHFDGEGKVALYGMETPEYAAYVAERRGPVRILEAMRNRRAAKG